MNTRRCVSLAVPLLSLAVTCPARAILVYATTAPDPIRLVVFDSLAPEVLLGDQTLTGLAPGQRIDALDVRPANGELYAVVASCSVLECDRRLAKINVESAIITMLPAGFATDAANLDLGFDIDPTLDIGRVIDWTGDHVTVDLDSGALLSTAALPSGVPELAIGSLAYGPSARDSSASTLFAIDSGVGRFGRLGGVGGNPSPDLGFFQSLSAVDEDLAAMFSFDIAATGLALAAYHDTIPLGGGGGPDCPFLNPPGSSLYAINLSSGGLTRLGSIGVCGSISALAIGEGSAPIPLVVPALDALGVGMLAASLAMLALFVLRRRSA